MNPYSKRLANISIPYPCCPQPGVQGIQGVAGYNGNNGAQGTAGLQGIQGISGIQGAQGTRGENGIGERGFDANSSKWRSQPNAQFVTIGNFQVVPFDASFVTINHIKISQFDYFSTDMNNWFNSLNVNDRISIRNDIQSNIYGIYEVSAPPQIISQLPNNPPPNNLPIVDISLTFISGINSNVGPYIINGVTQGPANFYIGYAITGPQGTSGGGGGGGDIRYIIVDPRQGTNNYATVTLPAIQSPMLGQAITVARTMVPSQFFNYDAGLFVKASTSDRINCPHSIFIDDNNFGGISIDPYNVMGNSPGPGFDLPTPYKGNDICSVTLVASQNGYYNTNTNGTSGGQQITTQFVWQFISSGSPGI